MCQNKEKMEKGEKNSSRIGFISDKLYFYESVKCLFSNRAIWVCIAVMYLRRSCREFYSDIQGYQGRIL